MLRLAWKFLPTEIQLPGSKQEMHFLMYVNSKSTTQKAIKQAYNTDQVFKLHFAAVANIATYKQKGKIFPLCYSSGINNSRINLAHWFYPPKLPVTDYTNDLSTVPLRASYLEAQYK